MFKSFAKPVLLALVIVVSAFGQEIHLKTRTITTASQGEAEFRNIAPARVGQRTAHQIVQFDHSPGVDDLAALLLDGAQVSGALPDNAVVVSSPKGLSRRPGGATWIGRLEAQDKISPALAAESALTNASGGTVLAIVEFHSDIDIAQQDVIEASLGATFFRPTQLLAQHVIVQTNAAGLAGLSERDEVAYMFPADPALLSGVDMSSCAGMLTTVGAVAQYANITHGWDLDADHMAHLGYFFGTMTTKVPAATAQSEILRALNEWANRLNVVFQPAASANAMRSIYIKFVSGAHGDSYAFTGTAGALAHTFYPVPLNSDPLAGDMHFNADEKWNTGSDYDIYSVALHEAGHALGLGHSDKPGDVMYPYYRRGMALSANDIGAAQVLYGAAGSAVKPVQITSAPVPSVPGTSALTLTVDAAATTTQSATATMTGTATGGAGSDRVQWQTDHGYSGNAIITKLGAWTAAGIPLVTGANTITLTAFDAANRVSTQAVLVTKSQATASAAGSPITISIASPTSAVVTVTTSTFSVSGSASGGAGITQITWQTSNGATGIASGADRWLATGIPLMQGNTTVVLRAFDAKGASAWVSQLAVRR